MRNSGLDEAQAGIKIAGRNINNFRYADDTTLMADSKEDKPAGSSVYGISHVRILEWVNISSSRVSF